MISGSIVGGLGTPNLHCLGSTNHSKTNEIFGSKCHIGSQNVSKIHPKLVLSLILGGGIGLGAKLAPQEATRWF